jgi:hypothetical protein
MLGRLPSGLNIVTRHQHHKRAYSRSESRGIRDWDEKREALRRLFGAFSERELATAILAGTGQATANEEQIVDLTGSFKSWYTHNPTGSTGRSFLINVMRRLQEMGCTYNESTIRSVVVKGTYSEFYDIIPEARRSALARPYNSETQEMVQDDDPFHPIWISRNPVDEIATARTGFTCGRIDQKLYYLSPDAVEIWKSVIDAGQYRQYDECKSALQLFTAQSNVWRDIFESGVADGAIMLGAGAPPKDLIVIRSMLELVPGSSRVNYALVDFSNYMLKSTFRFVDATLVNAGSRTRVNLTPIEWDFINLTGTGAKLRSLGKNVVWFIPGGTIGNLNERDFFASVAREAMSGDLLVIGAETISSDEGGASESQLIAKYNIPEVRRFVETPLRSVWHEMGFNGTIQEALKLAKVRVVHDVDNPHSSVPEAATVEISLMVNNRKIVLLTSTRYDEGQLIAFAARNGFKHEHSVPSPLNERYKQLVFRYVDPVDCGTS